MSLDLSRYLDLYVAESREHLAAARALAAKLSGAGEPAVVELYRHAHSLKGMAAAMGGDPTVTDPPRVMRLAGTIAWPVKPGRKTELTAIVPIKVPGPAVYSAGHLERLFPPLEGPLELEVHTATYANFLFPGIGVPFYG